MPLTNPVSIAQEAQLYQQQLKTWADNRGGVVKIMANLSHLWEELMVLSDKPRLLVCYVGERPRGDEQISSGTHRVDRDWQLVIVRGHGFKNDPSLPYANAEAFLDCVEKIRDEGIRVMMNVSEEFPVQYGGIKPMPQLAPTKEANVFLDAYAVEWSTAHDIPSISTQNPNGDSNEGN